MPADRRVHAAAGGIFVFTAAIRFLALVGFPNDHYLYLASAQQMLAGEWPSRDFVDPGTPLMYAVSATARLVVDSPFLAEALVVSTAFGLAAALTVYAALAASGSLWIAVLVTLAEVAIFPRSYHYPKLLPIAAGVLAMWAYARAPTLRHAALLAACVAVAFLFRHDLGVYLGAAAVVVAACTEPGWRNAIRRPAVFTVLVAMFVLPYVAYVEATTGVVRHIAAGAAYSRAEATRTIIGLQRIEWAAIAAPENAVAALFYILHALPILTVAVLVWRRAAARPAARAEAVWTLAVAVLAVAMNVTLLRDPLRARVGDVSVPACILAAWLIRQAWASGAAARVLAIAIAAIAAAGVNAAGAPGEQINRAGLLLRPDRLLAHAGERLGELQAPFARRQFPSRTIEALVPFFGYVGRCTRPDQRLFVAGEAPEVYVYARRLFAGGQPALRSGFFSTIADERRLVLRLREQEVPLALVMTEGDAAEFTLVMAELESEFQPAGEIQVEEQGPIVVRTNRRVTAHGRDAETGLPCFVPR